MVNLLERIAGWMQPWEFPMAYTLTDTEAAALMVLFVEGKNGEEDQRWLLIGESPAVCEEFIEHGQLDPDRYKVSPPLSIRTMRLLVRDHAGEDGITHVHVEDPSGEFYTNTVEGFLEWADDLVARGAH